MTLPGNTGGGDICKVFSMAPARGASITIFGCMRPSFIKNGSFCDFDRGFEPDAAFTGILTFCNREKATEFVNSLC